MNEKATQSSSLRLGALALAAAACALALSLAAPDAALARFNNVTDDYPATQPVSASGSVLTGADVPEGTYVITASTSSSMCKIGTYDDVILTSAGGQLYVTFYMSNAYDYIFFGTAEQAAASTNADGTDASSYYKYESSVKVGSKTHRRYSAIIDALNLETAFATYNGGSQGFENGKWYTRTVVFNSSSAVDKAVQDAKNPPAVVPDDPEPEGGDTDPVDDGGTSADDGSEQGAGQPQDDSGTVDDSGDNTPTGTDSSNPGDGSDNTGTDDSGNSDGDDGSTTVIGEDPDDGGDGETDGDGGGDGTQDDNGNSKGSKNPGDDNGEDDDPDDKGGPGAKKPGAGNGDGKSPGAAGKDGNGDGSGDGNGDGEGDGDGDGAGDDRSAGSASSSPASASASSASASAADAGSQSTTSTTKMGRAMSLAGGGEIELTPIDVSDVERKAHADEPEELPIGLLIGAGIINLALIGVFAFGMYTTYSPLRGGRRD